MSNVTAYAADGIPTVKRVIQQLCNDLLGNGTPIKGTSTDHMKLIYPAAGTLDFADPDVDANWPDDILVILEATTNIDPFADPGLSWQPTLTAKDVVPAGTYTVGQLLFIQDGTRSPQSTQVTNVYPYVTITSIETFANSNIAISGLSSVNSDYSTSSIPIWTSIPTGSSIALWTQQVPSAGNVTYTQTTNTISLSQVEPPKSDPWRIAFHSSQWTGRSRVDQQSVKTDQISVNSLAVYLGTPSTLYVSSNGDPGIGWKSSTVQKKMSYLPNVEFTYNADYKGRDLVEPLGNVGGPWTNSFDPNANSVKFPSGYSPTPPPYSSPSRWDGPDVSDPDQLFINKYLTVGPKANSFGGFPIDTVYGEPNSYRLVLTDHGMFIGVWGPDPEENGKGFNWLLVQRPVDKKTGIVRGLNTDTGLPYTGVEVDPDGNLIPIGNRPLFCVNSVNGKYWKFIVREHENSVPSSRKDATVNTPDSGAVINPYQQQSLTENGEYVITFLNNLNTSRFKYSDELDMLGTVSSDVVAGGSQINVNVYSEDEKRAYHALWSSGSFGTKMRIMVVHDIPTPNQPWVPSPTV